MCVRIMDFNPQCTTQDGMSQGQDSGFGPALLGEEQLRGFAI